MPSEHDNIISHIKVLNETIWEDKASETTIKNWLDNFGNEEERLLALYLLSRFAFFGSREMRECLKAMYRDFVSYPIIESIRQENEDTTDREFIDQAFQAEIEKTRFLPIGNPAESGAHVLYYFRQENGLKKTLFQYYHDLFNWSVGENGYPTQLREPDVDRFIFIDDFCGTGNQANKYSDDVVRIKDMKEGLSVEYHVVFGTNTGIQAVRDQGAFTNVKCLIELDESFKCFDSQSRYFQSSEQLSKTKSMALKYGKKIYKRHPLGYEDSQLMIGFSHNTPNNTLPIFWSDRPEISWRPLFKRYPKRM